ncbi:hypothetical protein H2198_007525 [Neophaeococcomyces mojaviensis]|uniref:Uncharacterized protein n=1 Tax=Neophaeococcomyces mojaviensis TaxID=3383035 RepID=A0ACC2ZZS0_9EURO|nr:hypothetical protein H2198_007525 [Knufia sp. JES_112]
MAAGFPYKHNNYDIIIIGGGTAGCVITTRLAEARSDLQILLLEAGGNHNDDPRVKTPGLVPQAIGDPNIDWNYHSVPQAELNGREIFLARGKGLGGSSLINFLGLVHPSKSGFDTWADIGNPGWDWASVLPYLKKFQTFHMPDEQIVRDFGLQNIDIQAQGTSGPIHASYQNEPHALDVAWINTFRNMGYDMKADTLSGRNIGGYQITASIDPVKRERSHAGEAYLERVRNTQNLNIVTNVLVDKVLFAVQDRTRASGVRFIHDGQEHVALASKEVILCAGAFGTPAILERSGVGNPNLLQALGIDVIMENENVGENLQDHLMCGASFELKDEIETADWFREPDYVQQALARYEKDRSGPLAGTTASFAYMPLLDEDEAAVSTFQKLIDQSFDTMLVNEAIPVAQRVSLEFTRRVLEDKNEASANFCALKSQAHPDHTEAKDIFSFLQSGNYITLFTALSHPLSRGSVHCGSSVPEADPRIDPAYYSHPLDAELMSRQVQLFEKIVQTEPMKSMLKPEGRRIPAWTRFDNLKETKKLIRHSCMSNQHPCGTCAMLPRNKGGVVDPRLRVYGVDGLRVCDASIMPIIPRCNLQSTVYTIAEKAADMFLEDLL